MLSKEERLNIYKTISIPDEFGYYCEDGEDSAELYDFIDRVYVVKFFSRISSVTQCYTTCI